MHPWVLAKLAIRPLIIVLVAYGAPLSIIGLFAAAFRSTGTQLFVSSFVGFTFGLSFGTAIADAARCSFSWTLPGFRRECILGFLATGGLVASVVAAIMVVGGSGAHAAVAGAAAFAGFAAGGAAALAPEGSLAVPAIWVVFLASRVARPQPVFDAVTGVVALAGAAGIAAAALGCAFGLRTWRWSALTPGPVWGTGPIWERWQHIPWWPDARRRRGRARRQPVSPGYFSSAHPWGSIAADVRTRPFASRILRFAGGGLWVVFVIAIVVPSGGRPGPISSGAYWMLPLVGLFGAVTEPVSLKAWFPWSRRDHLRGAFLGQLLTTMWYVLVAGPAVAAILSFMPAAAVDVVQAARIIAATAVVLPLGHLVHGVQPGASQWDKTIVGWLAVGVSAVAMTWAAFMDVILPSLFSTPAAQCAVLVTLIGASQVLYWRHLRRHFVAHDLVGNEG